MQVNKILSLTRGQTQTLKGLAILFVILGHMGYLDISGAWGVHIFLILSGYGIYMSVIKNGLEQYWKKRFFSVYIPYLIYQILGIFIFLFVLKIPLTSQQILLSFLGLDFGLIADRTMWYISYIFYWYFAFWVIMRVKEKWHMTIILKIVAIAFIGLAAVIGYTNIVWGHGSIAWAYFLSFPLGVVWAVLAQKNVKSRIFLQVEICLSVVMVVFFVSDYGNTHIAFDQMFFSFAAAALVILAVFNFPNLFGGGQKLLCFIGKYSLGMYLNEGMLLKIQGKFFLEMNKHISNAFILIVSLLLAVILDKYMIQPITKRLRGICK